MVAPRAADGADGHRNGNVKSVTTDFTDLERQNGTDTSTARALELQLQNLRADTVRRDLYLIGSHKAFSQLQ